MYDKYESSENYEVSDNWIQSCIEDCYSRENESEAGFHILPGKRAPPAGKAHPNSPKETSRLCFVTPSTIISIASLACLQ